MPSRRHRGRAAVACIALASLNLAHSTAIAAGPIRIWSAAVVVDDQILLGDIADLRQLEAQDQSKLAAVKVANAPPPGGSRILRLDAVRESLVAAGMNLATITLGGSVECAVTRPANAPPPLPPSKATDRRANPGPAKKADAEPSRSNSNKTSGGGHGREISGPADGDSESSGDGDSTTLRQAVIDHFNHELARYGGTAEITFDKGSQQVLELSSPTYEFVIRRRGGQNLGLTTLEADVIADGRTLQSVPLVVRLELRRTVVVARRTINQGATITPADLERVSLTFVRVDDLGIDETALAVGQRAKRVVPAGAMIEPGLLEQVPLVLRGQLVTVTSVSGSIRVVTAGKATQEGRYGEVIKVRCTDETQAEIDGIVTGPGEVRIGPKVVRSGSEARLASGEGS